MAEHHGMSTYGVPPGPPEKVLNPDKPKPKRADWNVGRLIDVVHASANKDYVDATIGEYSVTVRYPSSPRGLDESVMASSDRLYDYVSAEVSYSNGCTDVSYVVYERSDGPSRLNDAVENLAAFVVDWFEGDASESSPTPK